MSTSPTRKIAILGGGMAGVSAAWRLSEPGWRDRFESITLYQRGGRLGGKGASSRGANGRVEEHGLHIWLGYYDNAFRLLRECYEELDRERTDPECPIRTWKDALKPSVQVGLEDRDGDVWQHWIGRFATNDMAPGDAGANGGAVTGADFVRRAIRLLGDFYDSVSADHQAGGISMSTSREPPTTTTPLGAHLGVTALGLVLETVRLARSVTSALGLDKAVPVIDDALAEIRHSLLSTVTADGATRRMWHLITVIVATVRGIIADGLLGAPAAFARVNDEDYREWVVRHGAAPESVDSTLIRGLYDLVFGYVDGDPQRPGFGAGLGVFLSGKTFFDYKGAIFWKMQAGMGDVVFAPLHQALHDRGVRIEYFHRVDDLHLDEAHEAIDAVTVGRQVRLRDDVDRYDPLVRVKGLPCFAGKPLAGQLLDADGIGDHDLESFWCRWPDAETRVLRRGEDFDDLVFAIPVGMARYVCRELVDDRPEWRDMVERLGTVATQAFQIWLREDEPSLGWDAPGSTMSGYVEPFDTWASMPQLIDVEDWPEDDEPGTIAYFCNTLRTDTALDPEDGAYPVKRHLEVRENAVRFLRQDVSHLLPGTTGEIGFGWDLLCGSDGFDGEARFQSQFWNANVDPSELYVQSLPGTDRYRLRPDESGYANLYLAGDWTNSGLNAGCIEAAVLSGLKAANAVLERPLNDQILGLYMG